MATHPQTGCLPCWDTLKDKLTQVTSWGMKALGGTHVSKPLTPDISRKLLPSDGQQVPACLMT